MPMSANKDGILTWDPGKRGATMGPWGVRASIASGVGYPGARVIPLLLDRCNSESGACWLSNAKMAVLLGCSTSAVIVGLRQLAHADQILMVWEWRDGVKKRHIYPKANDGPTAGPANAPRGGGPRGTAPASAPRPAGEAGAGKPEATAIPFLADPDPPEPAPTPATRSVTPAAPINRPDMPRDSDAGRDPNAPTFDAPIAYAIEAAIGLGGLPFQRDRRVLTVTGAKAARAAQAQGPEAFSAWVRRYVGEDRERWTVEKVLTRKRDVARPAEGVEPRSPEGVDPAPGRGVDGRRGEGVDPRRGQGVDGRPTYILEPSIDRSSNPIPEASTVGAEPRAVPAAARVRAAVVEGCYAPGCRHPATYRCEAFGWLFCVRHRGNTNRTVPIASEPA